jgi:hypothetical protein
VTSLFGTRPPKHTHTHERDDKHSNLLVAVIVGYERVPRNQTNNSPFAEAPAPVVSLWPGPSCDGLAKRAGWDCDRPQNCESRHNTRRGIVGRTRLRSRGIRTTQTIATTSTLGSLDSTSMSASREPVETVSLNMETSQYIHPGVVSMDKSGHSNPARIRQ